MKNKKFFVGLTNGTRPKLRNSPDPAPTRGPAPARPAPPVPPVSGEAESAVRNHRMKWGSQGEVAGAQRLPPLPKNLIKNQAAPIVFPLSSTSQGKNFYQNIL